MLVGDEAAGYRVKTTRAEYTCRSLVLTAGAWTQRLVGDPEKVPVVPERQVGGGATLRRSLF